MDNPHEEGYLSDDEIFFGKLSLKEFKKHILFNRNRHLSPPCPEKNHKQENLECSLKLIETNSEPNLLLDRQPLLPITPNKTPAKASPYNEQDDSFVNMEQMVEKLCLSPGGRETPELNNTLEVIEYILNNGPPKTENNKNIPLCENIGNAVKLNLSPKKVVKVECVEPKPSESENYISVVNPETYVTPAKVEREDQVDDVFKTPLSNIKPIRHLFKTPAQPQSHKKPASSVKKTPSKFNGYQHITSPIASYINQSPQVPLVKDVHPRKPLPCSSSIPKLQKSLVKPKLSNKENIQFPSIAYKSAKKTKVINVPDEEKLPQNQWIKKITSSLPRPVVMKHDHREHNLAKMPLKPQEDSFADLSCHQADVSVCTQKSAFKLNKRF